MKVKILQDFDYSLDGINTTSFKEGKVTDVFTEEIARNLMDRKLVGIKKSKTISQGGGNAKAIKAAESIKEEKAEKEKFWQRVKEMLDAGAVLDKAGYAIQDKSDDASEPLIIESDQILTITDVEWLKIIKLITSIKADNDLLNEMVDSEKTDKGRTRTDEKNSDSSFDDNDDLGSESEK